MKVYRTKLEISLPGCPTNTLFTTYVTILPPSKCVSKLEKTFIDYAKISYLSYYGDVWPNADDTDFNIKISYKTLYIHPIRDIIYGIRHWLTAHK